MEDKKIIEELFYRTIEVGRRINMKAHQRLTKKEGLDFFVTQQETVDCLLFHCGLEDVDMICDFSCGNGAILEAIKARESRIFTSDNLHYHGSDIVDRGGKYLTELKDMFTVGNEAFMGYKNVAIIMNPPFNRLDETLEHYLSLLENNSNIKYLCLLHSLRSLEGNRRYKIKKRYGITQEKIINIVNRQKFINATGYWTPPFSVCWSIFTNDGIGLTEFIDCDSKEVAEFYN